MSMSYEDELYGPEAGACVLTIYNTGLGGGGLVRARIVEGDAGSGNRVLEGDAGSGIRQTEGA